MNKPRISWHPHYNQIMGLAIQRGLWKCSLPGTHAGWGDTQAEAYEHWKAWEEYRRVVAMYRGNSSAIDFSQINQFGQRHDPA